MQTLISKKKARPAILISEKEDFRAKKITRDEEKYYIMVKRSGHQDNIMVLNVNAPNIHTMKYYSMIYRNKLLGYSII